MAEEQGLVKEEEVKAPKAEEKVLESKTEETLDKLEIEVSDDTPEDDQNRKNLPKELVNRLESDELTDYDDKVKDKIYQLKKVWHDERREKERVQRENQEAIKTTQKLMEENKKLKGHFTTTAKVAADLEIAAAKREYKEAYDSGDSDKIVEAQQKLNTATIKADKIKIYEPPLQTNKSSVQQDNEKQPAVLPPDAKAMEWQKENTWFGNDEEMTSLALGLHEKLVKQHGISYATTDEYYGRIDETMRKRFPEHFDSDDEKVETKEPTKPKASAVVAPVTRTTSSKKIRLSTSQVNLAKKLGLTPEQYAKEMVRLENKND
jgi:hypothetical protein